MLNRAEETRQFIDCSTAACEAGVLSTQRKMPISLLLTLFPGLFGMSALAQAEEVRTLTVQQEVIMRVPVRPRSLLRPFRWEEEDGPKCLGAGMIRAASLSGRDHVDFVLFDRSRMRAELADDCRALDFYNGFYLTPEDGKVCARRDSIHSREGSSCRIEKFRKLVPRLKR